MGKNIIQFQQLNGHFIQLNESKQFLNFIHIYNFTFSQLCTENLKYSKKFRKKLQNWCICILYYIFEKWKGHQHHFDNLVPLRPYCSAAGWNITIDIRYEPKTTPSSINVWRQNSWASKNIPSNPNGGVSKLSCHSIR